MSKPIPTAFLYELYDTAQEAVLTYLWLSPQMAQAYNEDFRLMGEPCRWIPFCKEQNL